MAILTAALGVVFALVHAGPVFAGYGDAVADRGSGTPAAMPKGARIAWLVLCGALLVNAAFFGREPTSLRLVVIAVELVALCGLAIANGFWMHGRPNWSHHVVRAGIVVAILAAGFVAVGS